MSDFHARYLKEEEHGRWENLVGESPYGTLFHTTGWIRSLSLMDKKRPIKILGCFRDEDLVAGVVVSTHKKMGFRIMTSPNATPYYGPVLKERDTKYGTKAERYRNEVLAVLLRSLEKEMDVGSFLFPPEFMDIREFTWKGYKPQVFYTYAGELLEPSKLFDRFLPALKTDIRKGQKLEHEFLEVSNHEELMNVYNLIRDSYKRQGQSFRLEREKFISLFHNPLLKDHLKAYLLRHEGESVFSLVIAIDEDTGYYWLGGGNHNYFRTKLNQILFWEMLNRIHSLGIRKFDFMGANTPSISHYKSAYNFPLVPYYRVSFETGRSARAMMSVKRWTGR